MPNGCESLCTMFLKICTIFRLVLHLAKKRDIMDAKNHDERCKMIIDLNELRKYDFRVSRVNVIHQKPKYRRLVVNSRPINGFLLIVHGSCRYAFEGGEFSLDPDSVVYLPTGSRHVLEIESEDIEFFRVDFDLYIDGEFALFSNSPKKMCDSAPRECAEAVRALMDACQYSNDSIRRTELICTVLRSLAANFEDPGKERLSPAISYLIEHLTDEIDCSALARLCHLSSSQFYNLFREEYKTSPLAYRDSLLMQKATVLLQDMFSVTEVAEMLGFESVSYFSRFFKKNCGVSPLNYQRSTVSGEMGK